MTDALDAILRVVKRAAERLDKDDVTTPDLLDGLKNLAPYYAALTKGMGKEPDPSAGGTFADMKRRLNDATDMTEN
jgi:hypothetical protein